VDFLAVHRFPNSGFKRQQRKIIIMDHYDSAAKGIANRAARCQLKSEQKALSNMPSSVLETCHGNM